VRVLLDVERTGREPTAGEMAVLGRWAGWGAVPAVFDEASGEWAAERNELRSLLDDREWAAARRSTINAHYTSADVCKAMWKVATGLGFTGGRVLEPGCGSGNLLAFVPDDVRIDAVGVELEPVSARIARLLHPEATILCEPFERTRVDDLVDLVIANVPFGRAVLHDPVHNRGRHSIHNHFLVKSTRFTRPGGLVVALTSRYTLDAVGGGHRRELAGLADLVGAVRFPAGTFAASSGTDVVIDLLVLRRRRDGAAPAQGPPWQQAVEIETADGPVVLNEYIAARPELVLGTVGLGRGMYRDRELTVRSDGRDAAGALRAAVATVVGDGRATRSTWLPEADPAGGRSRDDPLAHVEPWHREGSIVRTESGFARLVGRRVERYAPAPASDRRELAALCDLRDALFDLLARQATAADDGYLPALQRLNDLYDAYARRWGPLNRSTFVASGRTGAETGEDRGRRVRPRMGGFRTDPGFSALLALEVYDRDTGTSAKAPLFGRRVVGPAAEHADIASPADALAVCLDERGEPDLGRVAELLGVDERTARERLDGSVWEDPSTGRLVPAPTYLSGDVRAKLAQARGALTGDERWAANVAALEAVVPDDLPPDVIDTRPGAPWIDASEVEAFAAEVLASPSTIVEHDALTATWELTAAIGTRRTVALTSEWGTGRADGLTLLAAALNQRQATVTDEVDGRRVGNAEETLAARAKQEQLSTRFAAWVWEDRDRAAAVAARYNERFNRWVPPAWDGSHLTLPGLAVGFRPHRHQRDAVWRIVSEPTVLLAHAVGAGKTATMVMAAMELRRLQLAAKPAIVVPNHMLDQVAREFGQLYPQAQVLLAGRDDTTPAARRHFAARCATGDWDAVVITHSAFERIPVSHAFRADFVRARIAAFREAAASSASGKGLSVKRLETQALRLEQRLEALLDERAKDDGVAFEETGIDYLFVDEAHLFKNRQFPTRIEGVSGAGSRRAEDLELKLEFLRSRGGRRIATFATATPIANSIAEMHVMQAFLAPGQLAASGVEPFDAWAAAFGETVSSVELSPDGASYRMTTRFARFRNVPELVTMYRSVADVVGREELGVDLPRLAGGRPETVVVPATAGLKRYIGDLAGRAEAVRACKVPPSEDNMLKITGDGRRAALDLRLVGLPPEHPSKVGAAASRIAALWGDTCDAVYDTPGPAGRRGALQLVFCDLGTPKAGEWSVYEELRRRLVQLGVPREQVRFVHEARDDRAKAELFAACRDGRVAVLVGSTEKMGVGTNVQARAVALHHLDCPWRPADLEQREGRILRQGNPHDQVEVVRYATEESFDVFAWQTVERKARFIAQIQHGTTERSVDDVGDQALSYAEVKALATGNPLLVEKAGVDAEVVRLERLRLAHARDGQRLTRTVAQERARSERARAAAERAGGALSRRIDTTGNRFEMTVGGERYTSRAEAGAAMVDRLRALVREAAGESVAVGDLGGLAVTVEPLGWQSARLSVEGSSSDFSVTADDLRLDDPVRLVTRLEHRVRSLGEEVLRHETTASEAAAAADAAAERLGRPFEHEDRLRDLRRRQRDLADRLEAAAGSADDLGAVHPLEGAFRRVGASTERQLDAGR
jgi:N12 class adenine-specific DNA methylase